MHAHHRFAAALLAVTALVTACSPTTEASSSSQIPALGTDGWTTTVHDRLTAMIAAEAGSGKVAVFDFDNTTQARDVSEAALAQAEHSGAVKADDLPTTLFPSFTATDGTKVRVRDGVYAYYDALMSSDGDKDPMREYASLPMPALVFTGRPVLDYVQQTRAAYAEGRAAKDLTTGRVSMVGEARRPFIYPAMADLYGNLIANGYDVWIVSAGITWGVRWMVQNALNPLIAAKYGESATLPLDHIVAISPLMQDLKTGRLVSDYQLTHEQADEAYINLDPRRLAQLEILAVPGGVESWQGGKLAAIADVITDKQPYFMAGDSDGDIAVLKEVPNRLVINRMEKPELAQAFADEVAASEASNWMLQPTLYTTRAGFLPTTCVMAQRTADDPEVTRTTEESLSILQGTYQLGSFTDC